MRKTKKDISYWIIENTTTKTQRKEIININQVKSINITCELSQVIISNYELKKTKEENKKKIELLRDIFAK